jgi:site-specific recombinase XerC
MTELQEKHGAPGVKQQLTAMRMLFDWLVIGQVMPMNPAAAVRRAVARISPVARRTGLA